MMLPANSPFVDRGDRAPSDSNPTPVLRFRPTAWAKLLCLRDCGPSEVGGFGLAAEDDLLCVEDVQLVRQQCSEISVAFDDEAVADYFDRQVDRGLAVERFGRIWVHTHPGNFPAPSPVDEFFDDLDDPWSRQLVAERDDFPF